MKRGIHVFSAPSRYETRFGSARWPTTGATFKNVHSHSLAPSSNSATRVSDPRPSTRHLVQQLFKAGTSIGANLEEAAAGQTKPDFIAKAFVSLKEAREARYWLRLIAASRQPLSDPVNPLLAECEQLVAILTAILRTARASPDRGQ
jgi:four helix bundle protein